MLINPYLNFDGTCEAAFKFYEKCLGGKITAMMRHGDMPGSDQTPAEWGDKIMHAALEVGTVQIMGSDAPPQYFHKPAGFQVQLDITDRKQAEQVFDALAEGGNVRMPFAETFFSKGFGMCTDRFGIPWMINYNADRR